MTEIWQLFGGLFIALIFASTVGYVLKRRAGVDTPNSVIDNLNARINAWSVSYTHLATWLKLQSNSGLYFPCFDGTNYRQ